MDTYASPQILEIFRHVAETARADAAAARQVRAALLASGILEVFAADDAADLLDLLEAGGEEALRARLRGLGAGELRRMIATQGYDPEKKSARWRSADKMIGLIVEGARARLDAEAATPRTPVAAWML